MLLLVIETISTIGGERDKGRRRGHSSPRDGIFHIKRSKIVKRERGREKRNRKREEEKIFCREDAEEACAIEIVTTTAEKRKRGGEQFLPFTWAEISVGQPGRERRKMTEKVKVEEEEEGERKRRKKRLSSSPLCMMTIQICVVIANTRRRVKKNSELTNLRLNHKLKSIIVNKD